MDRNFSFDKRRAVAPGRITRSNNTCSACGFSALYSFSRCPSCGEPNKKAAAKNTVEIPKPDYTSPKVSVFPFPAMRGSQREMIADVKKAVETGRHLVADAPTGLGKTVSSLFPALEYGVANGRTVFFLTSRLSQHKMAVETLKLLKSAGNSLTAVDIVGKQHLCSQDIEGMDSRMFNSYCRAMTEEKRCFYHKNSFSGDMAPERGGIARMLASRISSTDEAMNMASGRYCTYEILMDAARHADVVVGDYFHLFGIGEPFLKRMGKSLSDAIIIVDEAHNLSSRLRSHLSSSISTWACSAAAKEAQDFDETEARNIIEGISVALDELARKKLSGRAESFLAKEEFIESIGSDYDRMIEQLTAAGQGVLKEKKTSQIDRIAEFLHMWKKDDLGYARILLRDEPGKRLHAKLRFNCLDPSLISKNVISSSHSTILMSGTMRPMEMHRDLLGLESGRTEMRSYASPFPAENRKNIIATSVTTRYKERNSESFGKMAGLVTSCIRAVNGNVAVFFPSYAMRDRVCETVSTGKHIIIEKSEMAKSEKDRVKEDMKKHAKSGAVLFGVFGGSFNEGIDLPGDLLNGVIIVGLPLERPDLSVEALIDYYEKRFGRGRDYGYNFPAMTKVMQAAGRCIRTENDRGVIVFADSRFLWKNYRDIFPESWKFVITENPETDIEKFFGK